MINLKANNNSYLVAKTFDQYKVFSLEKRLEMIEKFDSVEELEAHLKNG
jgi:hypothetical protein